MSDNENSNVIDISSARRSSGRKNRDHSIQTPETLWHTLATTAFAAGHILIANCLEARGKRLSYRWGYTPPFGETAREVGAVSGTSEYKTAEIASYILEHWLEEGPNLEWIVDTKPRPYGNVETSKLHNFNTPTHLLLEILGFKPGVLSVVDLTDNSHDEDKSRRKSVATVTSAYTLENPSQNYNIPRRRGYNTNCPNGYTSGLILTDTVNYRQTPELKQEDIALGMSRLIVISSEAL